MLNYCKGNEFDLHKNTQLIYICMNGCAPGLVLKLRHAATRTWAIIFIFVEIIVCPKETGNNAYANFWRANKEYYGIF